MKHANEAAQDLIGKIAEAQNQMAQGWMAMLSQAAPSLQSWAGALARTGEQYPALQAAYLERQAHLWQSMLAGETGTGAAVPGDRRFSGREWRDSPHFAYLRQSYLLASDFMREVLEHADLEPAARERARFALTQWIDALCPANFAATNPVALRAARESGGESLARGLTNLIGDMWKGRISQSDESAFEVGRNLATTPGKVVYENPLIQLIQYAPGTPEVAKRPLVMVPPCINKYYILDLQADNSFVRYAIGQGHCVYMVSWRNVGPALGHLTWDDYIEQGVFEAFRVAREISRSEKVNALGFCVGGTLLGAALAVQSARGEDSVASATYLTTMLDFSETGQVGVFVDEAGTAMREASIGKGGILPGSDLASVFSSLRANDLVWPYVVNNYLLGGSPAAFDLLYWNADSTNLPGPMYCYYLRSTYLENRLREPGALTNCGVAVDLGRVNLPSFILATREDHIVPWRSAYRSVGLLGGEKRFVLGASGHVAGVINPADKGKRSFWTGESLPGDPDTWLEGAVESPGSWWPQWARWLADHAGGMRKAPARCGNRKYKIIEKAPGRYVKERAPAVNQ